MKRLLIVDDNHALVYGYLLRILGKILPLEKWEVNYSPTILEALTLLKEPWDVILMDYNLGNVDKSFQEMQELPFQIKNGTDLVKMRRVQEQITSLPKALLLGIADTTIGNIQLVESGADHGILKLHVTKIAELIQQEIGPL